MALLSCYIVTLVSTYLKVTLTDKTWHKRLTSSSLRRNLDQHHWIQRPDWRRMEPKYPRKTQRIWSGYHQSHQGQRLEWTWGWIPNPMDFCQQSFLLHCLHYFHWVWGPSAQNSIGQNCHCFVCHYWISTDDHLCQQHWSSHGWRFPFYLLENLLYR